MASAHTYEQRSDRPRPSVRSALSWMAVAAVAASVVGGTPLTEVASAEVRTGHTSVTTPASTSPEFPGLSSVNARYDDGSGAIEIAARLRTRMADRESTSALRSTTIEVQLGEMWGDSALARSCQSWLNGIWVRIGLGAGHATVELGRVDDDSDDLVAPISVSEDRRSITVGLTDGRLARRNLVCLTGNMTGPEGFGLDDPVDFLEGALLDGFTGADGDVGRYAAEDVSAQFRFLHNRVASRAEERFDHPDWTASCTPASGAAFVRCTAAGVIPAIRGRPRVSISGQRQYSLINQKGPAGDHGPVLRWRQSMPVIVRWRRCPRAIDRRRAARRARCTVRLRWRTGRDLPDDIVAAIDRRAARTGATR